MLDKKYLNFKISENKERGYTLIETMVAISVFLVVVMAGTGALLNANMLHNKSQSMRAIMDNLSFVMEDMSRNLRTGINYHCYSIGDSLPGQANITTPKSCPGISGVNGGWAVAFEHDSGLSSEWNDQWVYMVTEGKLFKATRDPYSDPVLFPATSAFVQLTPNEIVIDSLYPFTVIGAEPPPGDNRQPMVIIRLTGKIIHKNFETPFSLQTSVSQRSVDI